MVFNILKNARNHTCYYSKQSSHSETILLQTDKKKKDQTVQNTHYE